MHTHTHTHTNKHNSRLLDLEILKHIPQNTAHRVEDSVSNISTHLCPILPCMHAHFPCQCAKLDSSAEIKWTRTIKTQLQYILQLIHMPNRIPKIFTVYTMCVTKCTFSIFHFFHLPKYLVLYFITHFTVACMKLGQQKDRERK